MAKPSEPLGVSFKLGDLMKAVQCAIEIYGEDARIYADNRNPGIVLHAHFPNGYKPHVTFTHLDNDASVPGRVRRLISA
jgi:hypothetical protein